MKKLRFLCIILCSVIFLGLVGCTAADTSPLFDETLPWTQGNSLCTETCTYEFSRYLSDDGAAKTHKLNSLGILTYTVKEGVSLQFDGVKPMEIQNPNTKNYTLITMDLTVEYEDNLDELTNAAVRNLHAGKTDKIHSYAVIDRFYLTPIFTYKNTVIGAQAQGGNKSYTLVADYTGEISGKKEAKLTDGRGTFSLEIKDAKLYDSEALYYIIRGMRSVRTSDTTSRTFDIGSPYDDLLTKTKSLKSKGAQQSTAATLSKVALSEAMYGLFDIAAESKNEENELNCYKTTLSLTETKSGPPIELYYSSVPTVVNRDLGPTGTFFAASKVLTKSTYQNRDKSTNAIYLQEFVLIGYSNTVKN